MVSKGLFQKLITIIFLTIIISASIGNCKGSFLSYNFEKIGSINTNGQTMNVQIKGDIAFVLDTTENNPGGLVIIDISDPKNPIKVASFYDGGYAYELETRDNYVFIADGADGLEIINVTDLANPTEIYQYPVNTYCTDVELVGDLLYVANWDYGLEIFNISDIENPIKVARYDSNYLNCIHVTIENNLAVVSNHRNDYTSLVLLDITNPISPEYITQYVKTDTDFWNPKLHNGYLFVGNHAINGGEMQILNVTEPSEISLTSIYDEGGSIFSIAFNDSIAFIANYDKGLEVVDISNQLNPTKIGRFDDGGHAENIAIKNDLIFIADKNDGLEILKAEISTKSASGFHYALTISSLTASSVILTTIFRKRNKQ